MSGMMGNSSEVDPSKIKEEFQNIFAPKEEVYKGFQLIRDLFIFTNKRLILVDKQGITGKKMEYLSVPYDKINYFSVETAGHFDLDGELKIWVSGKQDPIEKRFNKSVNIYEVQAVLATYAC
nr:PH domain-containing protein [Salirhabdus salicampi]